MEDDKNTNLFDFKICANVPVQGGRDGDDGLVKVEDRVMWGGGDWKRGVYALDELNSQWSRRVNAVEGGARLAVCRGKLVMVGGCKDNVYSQKVMELRGGKWSLMSEMLVGCTHACVLSVSGDCMVVMGGKGNGGKHLDDVQVFNGKMRTWHKGPSLPQSCSRMSAMVDGDLVFIMGGEHMGRAVWSAKIPELTTGVQTQSVWDKLPDVPYYRSSVCAVGGVLLAIGGREQYGSKETSGIYAFFNDHKKWKHIGDLPFECSAVDTLLLSGEELMVVDGDSQQVLKIKLTSFANLLPITPHSRKADERRLCEEAMQKGCVETSITRCLILGAAGVGKTHLKYLLLNKDPPQQQVSTGVADNPVRAISSSLAAVSREEDNWFDDDQALMKVVCDTIGASIEKPPAVTVQSNPVAGGPGVTVDTTKRDKSVLGEDELIHHINSTNVEKVFGAKWIQFIDSGDQLQYHDILPMFIQAPRVTIFVLNLSEELSSYPSIAYQSSLSHQQILERCLKVIKSQDTQSLVITVGTHLDAADKCRESIEKKNQKLKKLMDAGGFHVLYNGQQLEKVIFAVNAIKPGNEDKQVARTLRQKIVSMSPQAIKMPKAWFALEVLLQNSSNDGILSLAECQECAKRLHIEGDAFSAALHHLVQHNLFLYYPEVLPQTVFCNPQVVLSKVTELVEYHHKLRYDPDEGVAVESKLMAFRDHGLLSVNLLREFPKYYKEGLFSPKDLLNLLLSVRAIAEIKVDEYFMPALLPHLDLETLSEFNEQEKYMIIRPSKGCISSGVFCCLVAHLLSPSDPCCWTLCMKGSKPSCLYHNCITFAMKHSTEIVTLADNFSYIVVHVNEMSNRACREIRDCIHSGLKSVCSLLKYQDIQFEDAFLCRGADCREDPPHVAVIRSETQWQCSIKNSQSGELSEDQLMWLEESVVKSKDLSMAAPKSLKTKPSLKQLLNKVAAVIPSKYWTVGAQLDLTLAELEAIRPQNQSVENCQRAYGEIFGIWEKSEKHPYTWETMIRALRSTSVGEVALSEELTFWITGDGTISDTIKSSTCALL